jgi:hypothetical protein
MDTKTISGADAFLLSAKKEDHFIDRKSAAISGAKLQKNSVRVIIPHAPLATPQEAIVEFLKKMERLQIAKREISLELRAKMR